MFECKYCDEKFTNPEIHQIHEMSCLDNQKENGLIKEETALQDNSGERPKGDGEQNAEGIGGEEGNNPSDGDLDVYSVKELKELAKEKGVKGYSTLTKEELIEALKG